MSTKESGGGSGKILEFKAPAIPSNQNFSGDKKPSRTSPIEVARNKRDREKTVLQMDIKELAEKAGQLLPEILGYDKSVFDKQTDYFSTQVSYEELVRLVRETIFDKNKRQANPALTKALIFIFILKTRDLQKI